MIQLALDYRRYRRLGFSRAMSFDFARMLRRARITLARAKCSHQVAQ